MQQELNYVYIFANISEQLVELRKSSLAKIICDCSDGITHAQMELMHSVGPDNPMVSCKDIPEPSFTLWKENLTSNLSSSIKKIDK